MTFRCLVHFDAYGAFCPYVLLHFRFGIRVPPTALLPLPSPPHHDIFPQFVPIFSKMCFMLFRNSKTPRFSAFCFKCHFSKFFVVLRPTKNPRSMPAKHQLDKLTKLGQAQPSSYFVMQNLLSFTTSTSLYSMSPN